MDFKWVLKVGFVEKYGLRCGKYHCIFVIEQGLGPGIEDIECQGDTPEQNDDPTQICFNIGSK